MGITFDAQTEVEDGSDFIRLYDGSDQLMGEYTGKELAGKTVYVPQSDTFKIKLTSDRSANAWGFKVTKVEKLESNDLSKVAKLDAIAPQFLKDGKAEPAPVVHYGAKVLEAGKDYTVSYQDNTKVGSAKVTVTGAGEYTGSATAEFKVVDADHLADGTTITKDQDVQLRQAGDEGAAYIELSDLTQTWADAVTGVTVTPIDENGKEGTPVKLNKGQYEVDTEYGELAIIRTEENPVFSIKVGEGKPLEVTNRWGETVTYPQSKQYKVSVEATGYKTTSQTMDFYTGASDHFDIVIDEDGKEDTTEDQKVVKSYTKADIDSMSSFQNGSSQCGMTGFRTFSAVGVPVEELVKKAGAEVTNKDAFKLDTTDNFGRTFSYDQLFGKRYFLKSIYVDQDVKDTYAQLVQSDDQAGATVQLRKLLAQKALEANSIAKPMISSNYAETLISQDEVANAQLPTKENTHINSLVGQENQFRFTYGISLVKEDAKVTFETGDGASAVPEQTVQTNLMTSTDNTTIRSTYWNDGLIIYRNGAEPEKADTNPEKLSVPEEPTREGYAFDGWYTKDGSQTGDWGTEFDFNANNGTVDQDTTLYAKWVVDSEARPKITADQKIDLRAASAKSMDVDVSLDKGNAVWAGKVTGVTVTPLDNDGKPEAADKLNASQYSVEEVKDKSGNVTGYQLVLHRSDEDHIVTANPGDLVDGKGMTVSSRWGDTTYPNAKQFQIAISADGYEDVTGTITVGTASSDDIQIVVKDGDKETVKATITQDDLKKMASYSWQNGSSQCGMTGVRTFSGNGATLKDIFKEAGVDFEEGDKLTVNTTDDFPASYTYDQIFDRYFIQGVYDDPAVEEAYKNAATAEGDAATGSAIAFRRAAAESAVKNNTKVEPFISDDYVETMLTGTDWIGNTPVPTADNTSRSKLVNSENKFRFIFGLKVAQQDAKVTFETGDGASAVPEQTVKTHLMTSTENTTMKTKYWVNKIVIEKGAGKKAEELKGADKIAVPETPTREGYVFAGWYTKDGSQNNDWGTKFDFNANDGTVDQDTTLYAKWIKSGEESTATVSPSYSNTSDTGANLGNYEYTSTGMGRYPAGKVDFTLNIGGANAQALARDAEQPATAQDWVAGVTKVTVDGKQLSYKAFDEWKNELTDPASDASKLTYYQLAANGDTATLTLPVAQFDTTQPFSTRHVVIESAGYKTAEFDVTYRNISSNELVVRILSQDGKTVQSTKVLSLDDLKKLPVQKNYLTSSNCDMAGLRSFTSEGVLLTDVLKAAGVEAVPGSQLAFRVNDKLAQNGDDATTDNAYSTTLSYEDLLGTDRYAYPAMWDETNKYDELGGKSLHEVLAADMEAWKNDSEQATFIKQKLAETKQKVAPILAWKWNEGVVAFGGSDPRASKDLNEYSGQQSFRLLYGLKLGEDGLPVNDYTTPNNTYAVFGIDVIGGKASTGTGNNGAGNEGNQGAGNNQGAGDQNNGGQNNGDRGGDNSGAKKPAAAAKPAGILPQTGDSALQGVAAAAAAGVACIAAAVVVRKRNRNRA